MVNKKKESYYYSKNNMIVIWCDKMDLTVIWLQINFKKKIQLFIKHSVIWSRTLQVQFSCCIYCCCCCYYWNLNTAVTVGAITTLRYYWNLNTAVTVGAIILLFLCSTTIFALNLGFFSKLTSYYKKEKTKAT